VLLHTKNPMCAKHLIVTCYNCRLRGAVGLVGRPLIPDRDCGVAGPRKRLWSRFSRALTVRKCAARQKSVPRCVSANGPQFETKAMVPQSRWELQTPIVSKG